MIQKKEAIHLAPYCSKYTYNANNTLAKKINVVVKQMSYSSTFNIVTTEHIEDIKHVFRLF